MRTLHLYTDRQENRFVQGLNAANDLGELRIAQGDAVQFVVHDLARNPVQPALTTYVERPLEFTEMRASFGLIDAAPNRGTFKLRVDDQTTAAIAWPADVSTSAAIATFKADVLAAIKALSNVDDADIVAEDPTGTPANIFYFRWTNLLRDDAIEVVENQLLPPTEGIVKGSLTSVGYTQLVKLAQFPFAMTTEFARPMPPSVTAIETRGGAAGVNCEQTIVIPVGAMGSFSLQWSGASTKTMAVATVTAEAIAAALNAIVTDGATNPSFRAEQRPDRDGKRFAVEFIGPLAAADQPAFGVTMHDQESVPWATGTIDLAEHDIALEQSLNGLGEVKLKFELAIVQDGEETFLREVVLVNDMTSGATAQAAAEQGNVMTVTNTVYVDAGLGEPFMQAAPGASFVPPVAGSNYVITHNLGTFYPKVNVWHRTSEDPEHWEQVPDDGATFTAESQTADTVKVIFATALNDDEESPFWRELWQIYIASPDSQLVLFNHSHLWSEIRETLPGGMTLAAKLAAIDAALGVIGGSIQIPAANITGLLKAVQLDLASLVTTLRDRSDFTNALVTVVNGQESLVTAIAQRLALVSAFSQTLATVFSATTTEATTLKTAVIASLITDPAFRAAVISALQLGPGVNTNFVPIVIPELNDKLPALAPGPLPFMASNPEDLGAISSYLPRASATNAGKYYTVTGRAYAGPGRAKIFGDGAIVYSTGVDWFEGNLVEGDEEIALVANYTADDLGLDAHTANIPSDLEVTAIAWEGGASECYVHFYGNGEGSGNGTVTVLNAAKEVVATSFEVITPGTTYTLTIPPEIEGRPFSSITFTTADAEALLTLAAVIVARVTAAAPTTITAKEFDKELFTLAVSEQMLSESTQLAVAFAVTLQLLGNCEGYYLLELLRGHRTAATGPDNLEGIVWDETIVSQKLVITDAATTHGFVYTVTRDDEGAMTAEKTVYTKTTAAGAPASATFLLRARLTQFDTQDVTEPNGQLLRVMTGARATVAKL